MTENTPSEAMVEAMAVAICSADGLDYHEVCGREADPDLDECDSGTCPAAYWEEHDAEDARALYRRLAQAAAAVIADALAERDARIRVLEDAGRNILPYLDWTIGPESPGYHPTMPSAVDAFRAALGSAKP